MNFSGIYFRWYISTGIFYCTNMFSYASETWINNFCQVLLQIFSVFVTLPKVSRSLVFAKHWFSWLSWPGPVHQFSAAPHWVSWCCWYNVSQSYWSTHCDLVWSGEVEQSQHSPAHISQHREIVSHRNFRQERSVVTTARHCCVSDCCMWSGDATDLWPQHSQHLTHLSHLILTRLSIITLAHIMHCSILYIVAIVKLGLGG